MTKTDAAVQTLSDINPDVVLEANQKMSKVVLLKDLYLEIDRMKQDVRASREKNGVYIPHERFAQDEVKKKKQQGLRQQQQQLLQSMLPVQTTFDAPTGDDPIALDMSGLGKGEALVCDCWNNLGEWCFW